jgi:hypothetical protein
VLLSRALRAPGDGPAASQLARALASGMEKELRAAVRAGSSAGLKWKQAGKSFCSELMLKVTASLDALK